MGSLGTDLHLNIFGTIGYQSKCFLILGYGHHDPDNSVAVNTADESVFFQQSSLVRFTFSSIDGSFTVFICAFKILDSAYLFF